MSTTLSATYLNYAVYSSFGNINVTLNESGYQPLATATLPLAI